MNSVKKERHKRQPELFVPENKIFVNCKYQYTEPISVPYGLTWGDRFEWHQRGNISPRFCVDPLLPHPISSGLTAETNLGTIVTPLHNNKTRYKILIKCHNNAQDQLFNRSFDRRGLLTQSLGFAPENWLSKKFIISNRWDIICVTLNNFLEILWLWWRHLVAP
jgi:hypothetical protein